MSFIVCYFVSKPRKYEFIEEVDENDDDITECHSILEFLLIKFWILSVVKMGLFNQVPFELDEVEEADGDAYQDDYGYKPSK